MVNSHGLMNRFRPLAIKAVFAVVACCLVFGGAGEARAAGLLTTTDPALPPLRITEHSVQATIHDQIALTTIQQTFHNDTNRQLEGTYVFPLPDNAELTNFQMSFNGKMVQGEVLPADQAARMYESIVRQMKDPGLIEFIGRRLLQMKVFPILPGSDTKIELKYQQICRPTGGMSGYVYPLRTAKTAGQSYGTVRFEVKLDTTAALKNIWSPTHSVEIVRDGDHAARIAYEAGKGSLEDDFVLLYDTNNSDLGLSVVAYKPDPKRPGWFVLTMAPKQLWPKQEYQPQDVVFVLDTSGSMAGEKIDQARAAVKFCIDQLDDRDRFTVVRFSTGFDDVFEQLADATKENRSKAKDKVQGYQAAGGTNIADTLKHVLDLRPRPAGKADPGADGVRAASGFDPRPFVVIFCTDGRGNQPAADVLNLVKSHAAADGVRFFTFGVGDDVDTVLLDQLATGHSGKPTYVRPSENLELILGDFFAVVSQPVLTNLKLVLPEIGASEKFPATLGDLYAGQQLVIAGQFENALSGSVKLSAMRNGQVVEYAWPNVSFTNTDEAKYVPSIWAGRKIAFLLDQIRLNGQSQEMVQEVMSLSQTYGIQTPYSSWFVNPQQPPMVAVRPAVGQPAPPPPSHMSPRAPRAGGTGGGGGKAASPEAQDRALAGAGIDAKSEPSPARADDEDASRGGWSVTDASGKFATDFARKNAEMRDTRGKDSGRLDQNQMPYRQFNGRWYNRIGQYWVDETVDEKTTLLTVKFGSEAYFELVRRRPDLREALAACSTVVVKTGENAGVAVSMESGKEKLNSAESEQLGNPPRT